MTYFQLIISQKHIFIFLLTVSKASVELKAVNRRRVEPFTCKDFRNEETSPSDISRLLSEDTFLAPNVGSNYLQQQVKMEEQINRLHEQISRIFTNIQTIDLDDVLQEVISLEFDENIDTVTINNEQQDTGTIATTSAIDTSNTVVTDNKEWHIDLTDDSEESHGGYDEKFAAHFCGLQQDLNEVKREIDEKIVFDALSHRFEFDVDVCLSKYFFLYSFLSMMYLFTIL